jgi:FkbH-like protein
LRKENSHAAAHQELFDALRREQLDAEGLDTAGRYLIKEVEADRLQAEASVLILGQLTTNWLVPALTAMGFRHGTALAVSTGGYDNILQDLNAGGSESGPDIVALLPWNQRFLATDDRPLDQRIEDELLFWRQAWRMARESSAARILQVGYDVTRLTGLAHQHREQLDWIHALNTRLAAEFPDDAYFLPLTQLSGSLGRETFYSPRRFFWTKQPFSEQGTERLARHLFAGVRALTRGPKKVLVLDLDNTLWGGVVGETGPLGIALGETPEGEAYLAFQRYVKSLAEQGCVLAVASKNNDEDAREPFQKNSEMVLQLDDLAAFEAHWEPKAVSLERIAADLRLGLDSFVFFDDNPAEREHIRQALPQVEVVEVSEDAADYVQNLSSGLWFETVTVTQEDRQRAESYRLEGQRREASKEAATLDDYLESLRMRAEIRPIVEADLQRVVQLIGKTNQFNLTTRRHSREQLDELLRRPGALGRTLRVTDRFGDYGLISVLVAVPTENCDTPTLTIDTWLMSCRVIGRTVEQAFFSECAREARAMGYQRIVGEFIATRKNALVAELYSSLGFSPLPPITTADDSPEVQRFELLLGDFAPPQAFVALTQHATQ